MSFIVWAMPADLPYSRELWTPATNSKVHRNSLGTLVVGVIVAA